MIDIIIYLVSIRTTGVKSVPENNNDYKSTERAQWIMWWIKAAAQQAITWPSVDQYHWAFITSLSQNRFTLVWYWLGKITVMTTHERRGVS